ncbi:DUF2867 domain-containing protein [Agromyces sp. Soil535]|uniref:DUF2867 domain-containing protein n=1 Tax=Agromyces sp. Soil535 TaxID=1736390 RepID=UPI000701DBDF|nr:DUF2867 domain-containing protein [Agromyces sp. Soil535]KRE21163.1 hypothetical protein ASG80_13990 [Agromyces sp. Soil535]
MPADDAPAFRSLALDEVPRPDHLDVIGVPLPEGASTDPALWTRTIFSIESTPIWVRLAFGLRQLLVPLIGVRPGDPGTAFAVKRVVGDEALVEASDRHLDFAAGVGVDAERAIVRLTTAVRLHGWRGRLYFAPVALVHPAVVRSMMRRAARRLTPSR